MSKAIREISVDSQVAMKRLSQAKVGQTITYDELSTLLGRNVQREARYCLQTACRRLLTDERMVFEAVRGVGMKRLDDVGIVDVGQHYIRRVHNTARRGAKKLMCVQEFDKLPNDKKVEHNASLSVLGMLNHVTKNKEIAKIEKKVEQASGQLPLAKMLEHFQSK